MDVPYVIELLDERQCRTSPTLALRRKNHIEGSGRSLPSSLHNERGTCYLSHIGNHVLPSASIPSRHSRGVMLLQR